MKKRVLLPILIISSGIGSLFAQDSSKITTNLSGFIDMYYAYDITNPDAVQRQPFVYNHAQNNNLGINMAMLSFSAESDEFHASVSTMLGDYSNYNLAHEPVALRNIYEAYGGFKWGKKLWIDAGVFGSNLGFESAQSTENITLTRSMVAENSPYYLSGIKATYTMNEKWTFVGLISNGWQIMWDNNKNKAFGTQITFSPNDNVTLNHSTFMGNENGVDWRIFNDFYTILKFGDKVTAIACLDYGMEGSSSWIGSTVLVQYLLSEKMALGLRGEYFDDPDQIVAGHSYSGMPGYSGFNVTSASVNIDCKANKFTTWRLEGRTFISPEDVYSTGSGSQPTNRNLALITSLAFNF